MTLETFEKILDVFTVHSSNVACILFHYLNAIYFIFSHERVDIKGSILTSPERDVPTLTLPEGFIAVCGGAHEFVEQDDRNC